MTFAALDFETANQSDASICAAGLAVFADGQLLESRHWLVRPPKGHGFFHFTDVHGLDWFDVRNSPEFPAIAAELLPHLTSADFIVAHNADFDLRVLRATLAHFSIPCPHFEHRCTLEIARRTWPNLPNHRLSTVAAHIGHTFTHHHAEEDAIAAGKIVCRSGMESRSEFRL